jgi:DNA-binding Xre family transcriptional regulator
LFIFIKRKGDKIMRISKNKFDMVIAENCISVKELSEQSGVPMQTISAIVNNRRNPKPLTVGKLARALSVKVADIVE